MKKCFLRQGDISEKNGRFLNPELYNTIKYRDVSFHLPFEAKNSQCNSKYFEVQSVLMDMTSSLNIYSEKSAAKDFSALLFVLNY